MTERVEGIMVGEGRTLVFVGIEGHSEDPAEEVKRLISSARREIDGDDGDIETALLEHAWLWGSTFNIYRRLADSGYEEAAQRYIMETRGWSEEVYDRTVEMYNRIF